MTAEGLTTYPKQSYLQQVRDSGPKSLPSFMMIWKKKNPPVSNEAEVRSLMMNEMAGLRARGPVVD